MGPDQIMWWPWAGMWIFPMIMFAVIIIVVFLFAGRRWGCWFPWSGPGRYRGEGGESESALEISTYQPTATTLSVLVPSFTSILVNLYSNST